MKNKIKRPRPLIVELNRVLDDELDKLVSRFQLQPESI